MTGRDAARDELAKVMFDVWNESGGDWFETTDKFLAVMAERGYRRSVTPDQIEAAEAVFGTEYHNLIVGVAHQFGLEVTE